MEDTSEQPKWLSELENRKRKPRLAHEAGAGAACMVCESSCPGLDLHFWRKICKNCKCSRDDHDVNDDEFPQFELLFGPCGKSKKRATLLCINNKQQIREEEKVFEWVPPDTTKELATDYMKALPVEKLPIKGSAGAALRKQQLQKQLPLHDIDYKVCDELTESEKKQFEKYLENLKRYAGQGKVSKMFAARPFDRSLMTPANATDMQRFSPQHKSQILSSEVPHLRTPSSFAVKTSHAFIPPDNNHESLKHGEQTKVNTHDLEKYQPLLTSVYTNSNIARSNTVAGTPSRIAQCLPHLQGDKETTTSPNSQKFCQIPYHEKLSHERHLCRSQVENSTPMKYVRGDMALPYTQSSVANNKNFPAPESSSNVHYNKIPDEKSALHPSQEENMNSEEALMAENMLADALLPPSAIHNNDIIGSTLDEERLNFIRNKLTNKYNAQEKLLADGSRGIAKELNSNNPLYNSKVKKGDALSNSEGKEICTNRNYMTEANTESPRPLIQDSAIRNDGKNPANSTQSSPQVNNSLPRSSNRLQAELCNYRSPSNIIYSENLQNQVFPHEITAAQNHAQQNLPTTDNLKGAIAGLTIESDKVQRCNKCQEEIRVSDVIVTAEKAENVAWHPGCFVCSVCNELLADLVYFYYKNKLYCGRDLAAHLGIPRCFACDELIFVQEYTVAEGHNYHIKHFCCWDCDVPLAGQQYVSENDRPLCLPCYQKTYAKTCDACKTVIAADQQGVAIKNLNFHAKDPCFACFTCKKNLLNGKIAVREDKLFCSKECISKFQIGSTNQNSSG